MLLLLADSGHLDNNSFYSGRSFCLFMCMTSNCDEREFIFFFHQNWNNTCQLVSSFERFSVCVTVFRSPFCCFEQCVYLCTHLRTLYDSEVLVCKVNTNFPRRRQVNINCFDVIQFNSYSSMFTVCQECQTARSFIPIRVNWKRIRFRLIYLN